MSEKELQRSKSVLPIGTVMELTDLTARQIRYYEEQGLVVPKRNEGNRRMYSLNEIDQLLEIKDYLTEGLNMTDIKALYEQQQQQAAARKREMQTNLTDSDVRRILHDEFMKASGLQESSDRSLHSHHPFV